MRRRQAVIGTLEQRVDERRNGARLREDDQQPEQHEHDDDRNEPVLLFLLQELHELRQDATLAHVMLSSFYLRAGCRCAAISRTGCTRSPASRALPATVRCMWSNDSAGSARFTEGP